MRRLTIKQKKVLEAIIYFMNSKGYSPTIRELSTLLNCGTRPIFEKIMILEEKGYISTDNGKARTIKVLKNIDEDMVVKEWK